MISALEWPDLPESDRLVCRAAAWLEGGGDHDTALTMLTEALDAGHSPLALRNMGRLYMEAQRWTEAEDCFRRADSPYWLAYLFEWTSRYEEAWPLVRRFGTGAPQAQLLARIGKQIGKEREGIEALRPHHDVQSLFERARLHDRIGEDEEAWRTAEQANAAKGLRCDDPFPERPFLLPAENNSDRPIFIVGMPRSGTTLLERMIAQHPDIESMGESEYFPRVHALLCEGRHGTNLGVGYLHRRSRRTIDKNPVNFQHVALIRSIFPDAVFLHMTRHRDDIAVSCFFRHFQGHHPWAYHWDDIQGAIDRHDELTAGLGLYRVAYEDLVSDTETTLRGALDHCGLLWDDACLDHTADPTHHSGSYEEARRPVNVDSVNRAERYRPFFEPAAV